MNTTTRHLRRITSLLALWAIAASAHAANVVTYNFNDGTTQGWSSTSPAANVGNALQLNNAGNGSLQGVGPSATYSLHDGDIVMFALTFDSYSTVGAPSQLTTAQIGFQGTLGMISFDLNMTGVLFGETRVYAFPIASGTFSDMTFGGPSGATRETYLANPGVPFLFFAAPGFAPNTASARMDDWTLESSFVAPPAIPELTTGLPVSNVTDATVKTLYPAAVDGDGNMVLRAKLDGDALTSANDDCILRYDASTGVATALVREGAAVLDGTIKKFGDPIINQDMTTMAFTAYLNVEGTVTKDRDVLVCVGSAVTPDPIEVAMSEGDFPPGAGTRTTRSFAWLHWAGQTLFIGASTTDPLATPKTLAGVWRFDGSLNPVVLPGDPITIAGTSTTVTTIYKPTAGKPAQAQTRVGNADGVGIYLKTADKRAIIRYFSAM